MKTVYSAHLRCIGIFVYEAGLKIRECFIYVSYRLRNLMVSHNALVKGEIKMGGFGSGVCHGNLGSC